MEAANTKLYCISLGLFGIGAFLISAGVGVLNPLGIGLLLVGVLALAAARAPSSAARTFFYLVIVTFPMMLSIYLISAGLAGGRGDYDPDPLRDIAGGLSCAFLAFAGLSHHRTIRSAPLKYCRWVCCFAGFMLILAALPDLVEPMRRTIGIRRVILCVPLFFCALYPGRVSFIVLAGVVLAWIATSIFDAWLNVATVQTELEALANLAYLVFAGTVFFGLACLVELWRFRLLLNSRRL